MSERLRWALDEGQTGRHTVEKTVRSLGYGIAPRAAGAMRDVVLTDEKPADHDHGPVLGAPSERGNRWYQTGKGKLVIVTARLLSAARGVELAQPQVGQWAFVAACLIGVTPVARRAFAALRMGQPFTIESLMTGESGPVTRGPGWRGKGVATTQMDFAPMTR